MLIMDLSSLMFARLSNILHFLRCYWQMDQMLQQEKKNFTTKTIFESSLQLATSVETFKKALDFYSSISVWGTFEFWDYQFLKERKKRASPWRDLRHPTCKCEIFLSLICDSWCEHQLSAGKPCQWKHCVECMILEVGGILSSDSGAHFARSATPVRTMMGVWCTEDGTFSATPSNHGPVPGNDQKVFPIDSGSITGRAEIKVEWNFYCYFQLSSTTDYVWWMKWNFALLTTLFWYLTILQHRKFDTIKYGWKFYHSLCGFFPVSHNHTSPVCEVNTSIGLFSIFHFPSPHHIYRESFLEDLIVNSRLSSLRNSIHARGTFFVQLCRQTKWIWDDWERKSPTWKNLWQFKISFLKWLKWNLKRISHATWHYFFHSLPFPQRRWHHITIYLLRENGKTCLINKSTRSWFIEPFQ